MNQLKNNIKLYLTDALQMAHIFLTIINLYAIKLSRL